MAHWIQVLTGPLEGMTFSVEGGQTISLGRVNGNDILLAYDPWISSQHALIKNREGQIFLMDTGSSNGSFVNAERLRAHHYVPVTGYFVLGATVFKIRRTGHPVVGEPLSVSHPDLSALLDSPLWRLAIDISRERRFPMVHSLHLMTALRRGHRTLVDKLIREMEGDLLDLDARLEQLEIFTGERAWMNRFIKYQTKVPHQRETLVTPLLQRLVKAVGTDSQPAAILQKLMGTSFNLLYPTLGLPSPDARPATGYYSTKDTKPAQDMAEALATALPEPPANMPPLPVNSPPGPTNQPLKNNTPPGPTQTAHLKTEPPQEPAPQPHLPQTQGKGTVELDAVGTQSDHDFASRMESVIHGFVKHKMGMELRYSDGSQSIQAHKSLSLTEKQKELEQQTHVLLSALTTAFEHWFEGFLEQINPDTLEDVAGSDLEARWKEFRYRFELMDAEFTKTHFLDIAMRLLKKQTHTKT